MAEDQSQKVTAVDEPLRTTNPQAATTALYGYQGVLLKQRYLIERELGRGGIGVILLARDRQLSDKPVVVKVLLDELEVSQYHEYFRHKFQQEIKALARLDHPSIVGALDAGEMPDGKPFFVMQYVAGQSLRAALDGLDGAPRGMAFARAATIIRQVGQALSAAHDKGIHHRDLKPENIMLQDLGRGDELVKLIDFGMATVKDSQSAAQTAATKVAGTLPYMSPEQLRGKPSSASDIFAFGVIAYEVLTGYLPFKGDTPVQQYELQRAGVTHLPSDLRPGVPAAAQAALLKALAFDAQERYQNARNFGDELADCLLEAVELSEQPTAKLGASPLRAGADLASGERRVNVHNFNTPAHVARPTALATAPQTSVVPPAEAPLRRYPRVFLLAAVAIVLALVAIFWWQQRQPTPPLPAPNNNATSQLADDMTFSFALQVQRYRGGKPYGAPYRLSGGEIFNLDDGDHLRFELSSPRTGYFYLINEGPQSSAGLPDYNLLFPAASVNGGLALVEASHTLQVPEASREGLLLDTQHGTEKVWLLWSAQIISDIEGFRARLGQGIELRETADRLALQKLLASYTLASAAPTTRDAASRVSLIKGRGPVLAALLTFEHH